MNRFHVKKTALAVLLAGTMALSGCNDGEAPVPSTTAPVTQPTQELVVELPTNPQVEIPEAGSIGYEAYLALDEEAQAAYGDGFESTDAFFEWLSEAQTAYYATMPTSDGGEEGLEDWE